MLREDLESELAATGKFKPHNPEKGLFQTSLLEELYDKLEDVANLAISMPQTIATPALTVNESSDALSLLDDDVLLSNYKAATTPLASVRRLLLDGDEPAPDVDISAAVTHKVDSKSRHRGRKQRLVL